MNKQQIEQGNRPETTRYKGLPTPATTPPMPHVVAPGSMAQQDGKQLQAVPSAVKIAFEHVKALHPNVTQAVFDKDLCWIYSDSAGNAPSFTSVVNLGLLEDAADALETFPVTFILNEVGVLVATTSDQNLQDTTVDPEADWKNVCEAQGWNAASQITHLEGFLRVRGLFADFATYANQAAADENDLFVSGDL